MYLKVHLSARLTSPGFVRIKTSLTRSSKICRGERRRKVKKSDKIGGKGNERQTRVERKRKNNFSVKKITLITEGVRKTHEIVIIHAIKAD